MMQYFKKIEFDLSDIDLESLNSGIEKHRPYNLNFSYNKIVNEESFLDLKNRLPKEYQRSLLNIFYCVIVSPFRVLPHRDVSSINVINYYHKPGNSITKFYRPLLPNLKPSMFDDTVKGMSYHPHEIAQEDQFVASAGNCYILNVSEIHSVDVFGEEDRHFISFSFDRHLL